MFPNAIMLLKLRASEGGDQYGCCVGSSQPRHQIRLLLQQKAVYRIIFANT